MNYIVWITIVVMAHISLICGKEDESWRCENPDHHRTTAVHPYMGNCYQFVNEERYWTSARDYCRDHGGRLVTIKDERTNTFIIRILNSLPWNNKGVWIGLHDRDRELRWHWSTESVYIDEPIEFEYWARGHPNAFLHSLRDCVRMSRNSHWKWHETPCSALKWKYNFICQYGMLPLTTTQLSVAPVFEELHQEHMVQHQMSPSEEGKTKKSFNKAYTESNSEIYTSKELHSSKTTNKPEFNEENSIVKAPMQLSQGDERNTSTTRNLIYGVCGCLMGIIMIIGILLILRRNRKKKTISDTSNHANIENPLYGTTDEETAYCKGINLPMNTPKSQNDYVIDKTVMNMYSNPAEPRTGITAVERVQRTNDHMDTREVVFPSVEICEASKDKKELLQDGNHGINPQQEGNEYLEPSACGLKNGHHLCMTNRSLPLIETPVTEVDEAVKLPVPAKRKPQRFVRSPPAKSSFIDPHSVSVSGKLSVQDHIVDASPPGEGDQGENIYSEISEAENIYECLDDLNGGQGQIEESEA